MTDKIIVLTTCETGEEAGALAESLVNSRLAACVQILPSIQSVYRWKGAVEKATELLLIIKTRRALLPDVTRELEHRHSYEVPEVVAIPIVDGLDRYLNWIDEQTSP